MTEILPMLLGAIFFMTAMLGLRYWQRNDVTIDELLRLLLLSVMPTHTAWDILIFIVACVYLQYYLIDHVVVSNRVLFNWSERE